MMKLFLILILLIDFSSQDQSANEIADELFFVRYLNITDEVSLKYIISDDFKHHRCCGDIISRNQTVIIEEVNNINRGRMFVTRGDGIYIENVVRPAQNQLNFDVRNKLQKYASTWSWHAELRGDHWKLTTRKDAC